MSQASAKSQKQLEQEPDSDNEEIKRNQEEKRIETRYYTLIGNAQKGGAIVTAQITLDKLKEKMKSNLNERQRNKLNTSIKKQEAKIKALQDELVDVEAKLKSIRASKPRQRTSLLSPVTSLFTPKLSNFQNNIPSLPKH